jgi:Protein kinase domain
MSDLTARISGDETLLVAGSAPVSEDVRFTPGTVVAGRYRIIALLGRGGMGEVYRAEDLRLNQTVALKYLPQSLASRHGALDRLYAEVRLGRQISHPNVCRLYDIIEVDGNQFIAMEYVDGEDLASLLRRVGKLPASKVVQIGRDLFAGLAAVHEHGVVHRDIKPANVMLDARGRARLTDFGLAAISAETGSRKEIAGTPAYMSPEQISGERVTPRSDLYALALVLYELFTGRRLFEGSTLSEIAIRHNQTKPRLTPVVPDLDSAIERIVMRCLEEDPDERPASAREVLSAFPDSDPLAALVRAGETPSPALIAAAGEEGTISERAGAMLAAAAIVVLLASSFVFGRAWQWGRIETKSLDALADRAADVVRFAGYEPRELYTRSMWRPRSSQLLYVERIGTRPLVAVASRRRVSIDDPPTANGMGRVVLDAQGRLVLFDALQGVEPKTPPSIERLIGATGRERKDLRIVSEGNRLISIEAMPSIRGELGRSTTPARLGRRALAALQFLATVFIVIAAVRNLRRGRVDRAGVTRVGVFAAVVGLLAFVFQAQHVADVLVEWQILQDVLGNTLFFTAQAAFAYIAIEPFLRRRMPHALISWSRLLAGRWRDPLVARDVLIGVIAGLAAYAIELIPHALPGAPPVNQLARQIESPEMFVHGLFNAPLQALYFTLAITAILVGLRNVMPPPAAAIVFGALLFLSRFPAVHTPLAFICLTVTVAILAFVLIRFGVLALAASELVIQMVVRLPFTLDLGAWYAGRAMFAMGIVVALVLYAWRTSTARSAQWMYGASDSAMALRD